MKKSRYTEEQIIGILKQHEAGVKTAGLCREHGISDATFYGRSIRSRTRMRPKQARGNAGVWKAWKAKKPAFHPSHTPWKSLQDFAHSHGLGDDYYEVEDRHSPPETRNQSHSHRKGPVNHVAGLKT
jgi:hypothetical protein